jgi:hypothetical protein
MQCFAEYSLYTMVIVQAKVFKVRPFADIKMNETIGD